MAGFFDNNVPVKAKKTKRSQGCEGCMGTYGSMHPKFTPEGKGKKGILFIIEGISEADDRKNSMFSSYSPFLRKALTKLDIDLEEDCYIIPAVRCKSSPFSKEYDTLSANCNKYLKGYIYELKPKVIIPLGKKSTEAILGYNIRGRLKGIAYTSFFGDTIPDRTFDAYICPTYSVDYIYSKGKNGYLPQDYVKLWTSHIENAIKLRGDKLPEIPNNVKVITELDEILNVFEEALMWKYVSFDYETTGIKPHKKEHKIYCASISNGEVSYGFPFMWYDNSFKLSWQKLMTSNVKKIAHNIQFEDNWSKVKCDVKVNNWEWDTLLGQHCLSNNKPASLKYLVYTNFGVAGYDDTVDEFITTSNEKDRYGANAINNIKDAPFNPLMLYCAKDSLYTGVLYEKQKKELSTKQIEGLRFLLAGSIALIKVHQHGINIDVDILDKVEKELQAEVVSIRRDIYNVEPRWKGSTMGKDLENLLYNVLKYKATTTTATGNKGITNEDLKNIGAEFTDKLLDLRKIEKLQNPFLSQLKRETVDGVVRPFISLSKVATFRSSSSDPNSQNQPKRDEKAAKIIRSLFKPRKGHKLIEYDYKALEVFIAANVFYDKRWFNECLDENNDRHTEVSQEVLFLSKEEWNALPKKVSKEVRQLIKGLVVFNGIYGGSAASNTELMWKKLPEEIKTHLKSKNIGTEVSFKKRMIAYDKYYWGKRYSEYGEKRQKAYKDYLNKGYIEQVTGFKCQAPLTYMQVVNYPIQGPASHVKLWTLIKIQEALEKLGYQSRVVTEIHDAILLSVLPEEEKDIDRLITFYGTKSVRKHWDWIKTPLTLEKEESTIDGNWAEMKGTDFIC